MNRLLSKDFLSGLMFIAFGLTALYFGRKLAPGTTVRMGPGYVPHMLSYILLVLGGIISAIALFMGGEAVSEKSEGFRTWKPIVASLIATFITSVLWLAVSAPVALVGLVIVAAALNFSGMIEGPKYRVVPMVAIGCAIGWGLHQINEPAAGLAVVLAFFAMAWEWPAGSVFKALFMVTVGIVCFALLFESGGLVPALIALILVASLGGEEFKLNEVLINMAVLAALCIVVFKLGLGMNIYIIRGVW